MSVQRISLHLVNEAECPVQVFVEPWGDELQLDPAKSVRIDFLASTVQPIPISYRRDSIVVEGWEGSTVEIWAGNQRLN